MSKDFGHLRRSQMAELGKLIGTRGFEAAEFEWRKVEVGYEPTRLVLTHKPSGHAAVFTEYRRDPYSYGPARNKGPHNVEVAPGHQSASGDGFFGVEWDKVIAEVGQWLDRVREDEDAPGFWAAFKAAKLGSVPSVEGSDDAFEEHEVRLLSKALDDVADALEKEAAPDAIAEIRSEIDALKADLATLKKGRWMRLAQGAFVNLLVRQLVPPELLAAAWQVVVNALQQMATIPLPPLGPSAF